MREIGVVFAFFSLLCPAAWLLARPGGMLDLLEQRPTVHTTISAFAGALGRVLENTEVGDQLHNACTQEHLYGGVLTVGALRKLGRTEQHVLYTKAGLGSNFGNTLNLYLAVDGEAEYVPDMPAGMQGVAGVQRPPGWKGGCSKPSFMDHAGNFGADFSVLRDIAVLPGTILDALPPAEFPVTTVSKVVKAVVVWLLRRFQCIHYSHPDATQSVEAIIKRVAELICMRPPTGRYHKVFEGRPSVEYVEHTAVLLLMGKVRRASVWRQPLLTPPHMLCHASSCAPYPPAPPYTAGPVEDDPRPTECARAPHGQNR